MKLSVVIITYNHEKFIAQALESALMQEVNFAYEIVVGEDCSTDNTRQILLDYQRRYPDKIRLLLPEKNQGGNRNFVTTFQACQGEYIAILEGDDFWTYPGKLQKQVGFLDTHPECSACFHNVNIVHDDGITKDRPFHATKLKPFFTLEDIVLNFFIPTCSIMFRNKLFDDFPDWYYSMPIGDWPLHVFNAEHGNFGYINEILACYRVHENGMWSTRNRVDVLLKTMPTVTVVNKYLNFKFDKKIQKNFSKWHCEIAKILSREGDLKGTYHHVYKCLSVSPFSDLSSKAKLPFILLLCLLSRWYLFSKRVLGRHDKVS